MDCIFCQIVAGQVPSDTLYQDEKVMAFRDIRPITPTHVVIIPKKHIPSLLKLSDADLPLMADLVKAANQLAKREGIAEKGYRLVINCGREGTQLVPHLHMHLLGGRQLSAMLG
jgi:histidine triad (HIT) family protein